MVEGEDMEVTAAELRLAEARYAALLQASLDAIVVMDAEGQFLEFSPAAESMFGYRREQVIGRPIADFIIPHRLRESHRIGMARYIATRTGLVVDRRVELPALRANGQEFPVEIVIAPVESGDRLLFVGFIRDITEREEAEQRRRVILDESAHRMRNLLSVVQAIVVSTLATSPLPEARDVLQRRINALARSNAVLGQEPSASTSLTHIAAEEMEGFSDRVEIEGPDVRVGAASLQTFSLILHELATNAAKHGALSASGGSVVIRWTISEGVEPYLTLEWREHGGPVVSAPSRTGFGRTVLEAMAAKQFHTTPIVDFASGGLTYRLEAPLALLAK